MTPPIDPPQVWDASPWDPTPSPPINGFLRSAWVSPPFTPNTRDQLVAAIRSFTHLLRASLYRKQLAARFGA